MGLGGVLWGVVWSWVVLGGLGCGLGWVSVAGPFRGLHDIGSPRAAQRSKGS